MPPGPTVGYNYKEQGQSCANEKRSDHIVLDPPDTGASAWFVGGGHDIVCDAVLPGRKSADRVGTIRLE